MQCNAAEGWVALLAEGVGRNSLFLSVACWRARVALLAEGVGRNMISCLLYIVVTSVALLAEGVGRNQLQQSGQSADI